MLQKMPFKLDFRLGHFQICNKIQKIGDLVNGVLKFTQEFEDLLGGPYPTCSHLSYDINNRKQFWRFLTYALVHDGFGHVLMNVFFFLLVGIPLEMVHGGLRK